MFLLNLSAWLLVSARSKSAISVPLIVAISFSSPPLTAHAYASLTVIVRPGLTTLPMKNEPVASSRSEQVEFEFHCEDSRILGHERERRITAGAIERGRGDAGVNEAMLLRTGCEVRHGQSDFPRFEPRNLDCESPYRLLPAKLSRTRVSKRRSFGLNEDIGRFPGLSIASDECRRRSILRASEQMDAAATAAVPPPCNLQRVPLKLDRPWGTAPTGVIVREGGRSITTGACGRGCPAFAGHDFGMFGSHGRDKL